MNTSNVVFNDERLDATTEKDRTRTRTRTRTDKDKDKKASTRTSESSMTAGSLTGFVRS